MSAAGAALGGERLAEGDDKLGRPVGEDSRVRDTFEGRVSVLGDNIERVAHRGPSVVFRAVGALQEDALGILLSRQLAVSAPDDHGVAGIVHCHAGEALIAAFGSIDQPFSAYRAIVDPQNHVAKGRISEGGAAHVRVHHGDVHGIGDVQRILAEGHQEERHIGVKIEQVVGGVVLRSVLHEAGLRVASGVDVIVAAMIALPRDHEIAVGVHRHPRVLLVALGDLIHLEHVASLRGIVVIASGEDAVFAVDAGAVAAAHAILPVARPRDHKIAV